MSASVPQPHGEPDPPRRILVVDDNVASRYATARQLRSAGFQTVEASTGREALERADASVSLVVLDIQLPDIDGFECCRLLRERPDTASLPVVHLSAAYTDVHDHVRGLQGGADAYLTRPVETSVLLATVQTLLRARGAEDALRRSSAQVRAIHEQAPCGIGLLDADGRLVQANPPLLALLRCGADAALGRPLTDFVGPADRERVRAWLAPGPLRGRAQFTLPGPEGDVRHVEATFSAQAGSAERVVVVNDYSEHVALEEARADLLRREQRARNEAERVGRFRDELLAVLSHELRTPLNAILSWTQVLLRREGGDELRRGLSAIDRNARLQARLITDMLDLSRLTVGKLRLEAVPSEPAALVADALNDLGNAGAERRVSLRWIPPDTELPTVLADPGRVQQILWNLVTNAVKFSRPGGEVRVRLEPAPGGVRLKVEDDGEGIAPEFLPLLFERFTQGDLREPQRQRGLGLGLAIVRHLVELHGGHIEAHSAGKGRGACFSVFLPTHVPGRTDPPPPTTAPAVGIASAEATAADPVLADADILIVDDDREAAGLLAVVLRERRARVRVAHDVDTALGEIQRAVPHLVISDIGMPGRDGYDLVRTLRRFPGPAARIPALALSAYTRPQDVQRATEAGFDAHCAKPVVALDVLRAASGLLAASKATR